MTNAGPYKQAGGRLWRLIGNDWKEVSALAFEPMSLCSAPDGELWLVGGEAPRVFTIPPGGVAPVEVLQPVTSPSAVHCAPGGGVWIGGVELLALHEAGSFAGVIGSIGAIHVIASSADDSLWVGGEGGLFVGRRAEVR